MAWIILWKSLKYLESKQGIKGINNFIDTMKVLVGMLLGEQCIQDQDFWRFMSDPGNQERANRIVEGARLFADTLERRLVMSGIVDVVEVEPYPQDTFTVLVYIRKGDKHFSLNMEDICFRPNNSFSARLRIYGWIETAKGTRYGIHATNIPELRDKLILYESGIPSISLKPEDVKNVFVGLYNEFIDIHNGLVDKGVIKESKLPSL